MLEGVAVRVVVATCVDPVPGQVDVIASSDMGSFCRYVLVKRVIQCRV